MQLKAQEAKGLCSSWWQGSLIRSFILLERPFELNIFPQTFSLSKNQVGFQHRGLQQNISIVEDVTVFHLMSFISASLQALNRPALKRMSTSGFFLVFCGLQYCENVCPLPGFLGLCIFLTRMLFKILKYILVIDKDKHLMQFFNDDLFN